MTCEGFPINEPLTFIQSRSMATVDVDALMAEVRERVRAKRERGIYDAAVDEMLRAPLPGGPAVFADELADPLAALPSYLGAEVAYDPRSRKRIAGPLITFARRSLMWLLRWWIRAITDQQDRVNKLVLAALQDLDARSGTRLEARLARLEAEWRKRREHEGAANLHWVYFAARFGGSEEQIREHDLTFAPIFRGRRRVLDVGSGRGTFLEVAREQAIGAYGIEPDARLAQLCRDKGLEVHEVDAEEHLRSLADRSIDGVFARHVAEHIEPGALVEILRQCRRVLAPGAPIVMITPNVATLTVGAHTFWRDPSHRRPIPPELFEFLLLVEGFVDVRVQTYERSETRLSEDLPEGAARENARLLNETLFGDRDYAVIGYQPSTAG